MSKPYCPHYNIKAHPRPQPRDRIQQQYQPLVIPYSITTATVNPQAILVDSILCIHPPPRCFLSCQKAVSRDASQLRSVLSFEVELWECIVNQEPALPLDLVECESTPRGRAYCRSYDWATQRRVTPFLPSRLNQSWTDVEVSLTQRHFPKSPALLYLMRSQRRSGMACGLHHVQAARVPASHRR